MFNIKPKTKSISRMLTIALIALVCAAFFFVAGTAQSYAKVKTSLTQRYPEQFKQAKGLPAFAALSEKSFPIPGLKITNIRGKAWSTYIPQGICLTSNYILTTAYEQDDKERSVIQVLDKQGNYLRTLVMEDANHVGGIAYDGNDIYIARSTNNELGVIHESTLESTMAQADSVGKFSVVIKYDAKLGLGDFTASFVTFYKGFIWVGYCDMSAAGNSGKIRGYKREGDSLTQEKELPIPAWANGAAFMEYNGNDLLIVNQSRGRKYLSYACGYHVDLKQDGDDAIQKSFEPLVLPSMAQEIAIEDDRAYMIYESAATKYSKGTDGNGTPLYVVDSVTIGDAARLFPEADKLPSKPSSSMIAVTMAVDRAVMAITHYFSIGR